MKKNTFEYIHEICDLKRERGDMIDRLDALKKSNAATLEALKLATSMLEHIKDGGSYPTADYLGHLHYLRHAVATAQEVQS